MESITRSAISMLLSPWLCNTRRRQARLRPPVQHGAPSADRRLLCRQASTSALLHFLRKVEHGLLRDDAPVATGKEGLRPIDAGENFPAGAFPGFPQGKSFLPRHS